MSEKPTFYNVPEHEMKFSLQHRQERAEEGEEIETKSKEETVVPDEFSDFYVLEDGTVVSENALEHPEEEERLSDVVEQEKNGPEIIKYIQLTDGRKISLEAWEEAKEDGKLDEFLGGAKLKLRNN